MRALTAATTAVMSTQLKGVEGCVVKRRVERRLKWASSEYTVNVTSVMLWCRPMSLPGE